MLSGPSGAGKSTLLKRLMKEHEGVFGFSVSRTSEEEVGQQPQCLSSNCALADISKPVNAETEAFYFNINQH